MKDIIQKRLEKYNPLGQDEELNALKEITQEVALYSLYKAGFFQDACFLGGTSLRILHGLDRFSEDLDFSLWKKDQEFSLDDYLDKAMVYMNAYGYDLSFDKKDLSDKAVQSRFIKDDSIKNVLTFKHFQDTRSKIKIKIEIDTNPPIGADRSVEYVNFPLDFPVSAYDLKSCMSGKIHALLCRPYVKGRDWYDLLWYISESVSPNLVFLKNALFQMGPWKGIEIELNENFIKNELQKKIQSLDWNDVKFDVRKFLKPEKAETLDLWSIEFFEKKIIKFKT
ncbi:MAG: nucleotidyl transferase AbiEii/AbiGii toxin family protein [Bacteriovorax sp.]|nr:nucleotidyl transferase AbiEii/AbiGii toxin family protein [Bacteriovorax sp.]